MRHARLGLRQKTLRVVALSLAATLMLPAAPVTAQAVPLPQPQPGSASVANAGPAAASQAANAQSSAKTALDTARKEESEAYAAVKDADARVTQLEGERPKYSEADAKAARAVSDARQRVRRSTLASYVAGGTVAFTKVLLEEQDVNARARRRTYANAVMDAYDADIKALERAKKEASDRATAFGKAIDDARVAKASAQARAQAASSIRLQREAEVLTSAQVLQSTNLALPVGGTDVPDVFAQAYIKAAAATAKAYPTCGLHWSGIAAVGRVETNQGRMGNAEINTLGQLLPPILGPRLDGSNGRAAVADSDQGALDGDSQHDRAVGPMQFLPSVWKQFAYDGNGDGISDPNNIWDAAMATAVYLCQNRTGLQYEPGLHQAAMAYNNSQEYASRVVAQARTYGQANVPGATKNDYTPPVTQGAPGAGGIPPVPNVQGPTR